MCTYIICVDGLECHTLATHTHTHTHTHTLTQWCSPFQWVVVLGVDWLHSELCSSHRILLSDSDL